ncbi:MAG TPA: YggS family pyridoxal phosphate-dependent enzyme [Armatimonadetes bacterium]|jgi:hypothetical protein|nr:YggS family pyridoxal phosphate-dependent enzyme [Armatimonadota bacterium]
MAQADIAANYRSVAERVSRAAEAAGRKAGDICLVAVSKTRSIAEIRTAIEAGAVDLGENYVQEMVEKAEAFGTEAAAPRWHYIGHLQRNKCKYVAGFCHLVHSVDSARLIEELDRRAGQFDRVQPILLQLDLAQEETKFGAAEHELEQLVQAAQAAANVDWQGLMCMAPFSDDAETARPYYARLRAISEQLSQAGVPDRHLRHLSMGMTSDFEVAIEEGATIVRVGTAVFGPRQ